MANNPSLNTPSYQWKNRDNKWRSDRTSIVSRNDRQSSSGMMTAMAKSDTVDDENDGSRHVRSAERDDERGKENEKKADELQFCFECKNSLAKSPELINITGQSRRWHPECFKCMVCHEPMDKRQSCHVYKDQIFCRSDYMRLKLDHSIKCKRCHWPIGASDWVRRAADYVYHLACFNCDICFRQLNTGEQFVINSQPNESDGSADSDCIMDQHDNNNKTVRLMCKLHFTVESGGNNKEEQQQNVDVDTGIAERTGPSDKSPNSRNHLSPSCSIRTDKPPSTDHQSSIKLLGKQRQQRHHHHQALKSDRFHLLTPPTASCSASSATPASIIRPDHHHHHHHQAAVSSISATNQLQAQPHSQATSQQQQQMMIQQHSMSKNFSLMVSSSSPNSSSSLMIDENFLVTGNRHHRVPSSSSTTSPSTASSSSTTNLGGGCSSGRMTPTGCSGTSGGLQSKSKRVRTTFTEDQLSILQTHFQIDSNPDGQDLERIATITGLSKRVTQVWFQNSRARQKKYMIKRKPSHSSAAASLVSLHHQQQQQHHQRQHSTHQGLATLMSQSTNSPDGVSRSPNHLELSSSPAERLAISAVDPHQPQATFDFNFSHQFREGTLAPSGASSGEPRSRDGNDHDGDGNEETKTNKDQMNLEPGEQREEDEMSELLSDGELDEEEDQSPNTTNDYRLDSSHQSNINNRPNEVK